MSWFLRAAGNMAAHVNSDDVDKCSQTKLPKDIKMAGVMEMEGLKVDNNKEVYPLNGRVNGGAKECSVFQMPLHYPRYKKEDYQRMEEWKLDMLLKEYGIECDGSLEEKRVYAIGAFLWSDEL